MHLLIFLHSQGLDGFDSTSSGNYDDEGRNPEMRGAFLATGPSFKKGYA